MGRAPLLPSAPGCHATATKQTGISEFTELKMLSIPDRKHKNLYHPQSLEERLLKSETERKILESKYEYLTNTYRKGEDARLLQLKHKYEEFMSSCIERNRRNDDILKTLQRLENGSSAVFARTERLKQLRNHYDAYLSRAVPLWRHPDALDTPPDACYSPWIRRTRVVSQLPIRPALLLPGGGAVMLPFNQTAALQPATVKAAEARENRGTGRVSGKGMPGLGALGDAGMRMMKELSLIEGNLESNAYSAAVGFCSPDSNVQYQPYHLPVYIPPSYCPPPIYLPSTSVPDCKALHPYDCGNTKMPCSSSLGKTASEKTLSNSPRSPVKVLSKTLSEKILPNLPRTPVKAYSKTFDNRQTRSQYLSSDPSIFDNASKEAGEIECLPVEENRSAYDTADAALSDDELDVAIGRSVSPSSHFKIPHSPKMDSYSPSRPKAAVSPQLPVNLQYFSQDANGMHQKSVQELKALMSEGGAVTPQHTVHAAQQEEYLDEDVPDDFNEQNYSESEKDARYQRDVLRNVILEEDEEDDDQRPIEETHWGQLRSKMLPRTQNVCNRLDRPPAVERNSYTLRPTQPSHAQYPLHQDKSPPYFQPKSGLHHVPQNQYQNNQIRMPSNLPHPKELRYWKNDPPIANSHHDPNADAQYLPVQSSTEPQRMPLQRYPIVEPNEGKRDFKLTESPTSNIRKPELHQPNLECRSNPWEESGRRATPTQDPQVLSRQSPIEAAQGSSSNMEHIQNGRSHENKVAYGDDRYMGLGNSTEYRTETSTRDDSTYKSGQAAYYNQPGVRVQGKETYDSTEPSVPKAEEWRDPPRRNAQYDGHFAEGRSAMVAEFSHLNENDARGEFQMHPAHFQDEHESDQYEHQPPQQSLPDNVNEHHVDNEPLYDDNKLSYYPDKDMEGQYEHQPFQQFLPNNGNEHHEQVYQDNQPSYYPAEHEQGQYEHQPPHQFLPERPLNNEQVYQDNKLNYEEARQEEMPPNGSYGIRYAEKDPQWEHQQNRASESQEIRNRESDEQYARGVQGSPHQQTNDSSDHYSPIPQSRPMEEHHYGIQAGYQNESQFAPNAGYDDSSYSGQPPKNISQTNENRRIVGDSFEQNMKHIDEYSGRDYQQEAASPTKSYEGITPDNLRRINDGGGLEESPPKGRDTNGGDSPPGPPGSGVRSSVLHQLLDSDSESYHVDPVGGAAGSQPEDSDFDFSIGKQ